MFSTFSIYIFNPSEMNLVEGYKTFVPVSLPVTDNHRSPNVGYGGLCAYVCQIPSLGGLARSGSFPTNTSLYLRQVHVALSVWFYL